VESKLKKNNNKQDKILAFSLHLKARKNEHENLLSLLSHYLTILSHFLQFEKFDVSMEMECKRSS
jgi:hypothetical protein